MKNSNEHAQDDLIKSAALSEDERAQTAHLIQLINSPDSFHECISELTSFLQRWADCEAVGVRLRSGVDYPYYETRGFPAAFVEAEKHLCAYSSDGTLMRDNNGEPVLECMCGNILSGRFDSSKPYFTPFGSFWTDDSTDLLSRNPELNNQAHARNRCFHEGYESLALIPMHIGDQVFGLLQFNDHRPGRFTSSLITLLEEMADGVALSLANRQSREALIKSENALKRSQRLLAETERVGKVGGWEFDTETMIQVWTDELYAIFELNRSFEPTVEKGINLYTPESRPIIERAVQRVIDSGEPFDEELEIFTGMGTMRSVHVIGRPDLEHHRIYGFCQDITERKFTEKYREMSRKILHILNGPGNLEELIPHALTELKTQTGFDAVGIRLQKDDDFPYFVQEGFPADFLLVENSLLERSVDGGICRDSEGRVSLECTCGLVIAGKTDPTNPLFTVGGSCWTNDSFPLLEIPPNADPRLHPRNECIHQGYASVALVPIRDGGKIVGLIQFNDRRKNCLTLEQVERLEEIAACIGAVLTRKRLEGEKLELLQQFQETQKLQGLGVLAGGIAHDFNNILAVIMGYCSLIKMDYTTAEKRIPPIEEAAERAAGLCRQMLAYAGKAPFVKAKIDITALVDDSINILKSSLPINTTITCHISPDISSITADASQVSQVVINLVTNASEAIGENQGEVILSLAKTEIKGTSPEKDHLSKLIPIGRYMCLEVSDNGCGMDDETVRHVFEPFYTTKFAGRGLGLPAVLGIVTAHGGAIQVSSRKGHGTSFKIYLPLQDDDSNNEMSHNRTPASINRLGSGIVLLVEDESQVRFIAKSFLELFGFTVLEAENGRDALEVYKNVTDIILVITDVGMPFMNGYELFRELKRLNPTLPIIVSSGFGNEEVVAQLNGYDIAGLLSKPYNPEQLREVVKSAVENASIR